MHQIREMNDAMVFKSLLVFNLFVLHYEVKAKAASSWALYKHNHELCSSRPSLQTQASEVAVQLSPAFHTNLKLSLPKMNARRDPAL